MTFAVEELKEFLSLKLLLELSTNVRLMRALDL